MIKKKNVMKNRFVSLVIITSFVGMFAVGIKVSNQRYESLVSNNIEALSNPEYGNSSSWRCYIELKKGAGCYRCAIPCIWEKQKNPSNCKESNSGLCY